MGCASGLRLGLVEVRRRLATVGDGVQLGLRGDAAWARLATEAEAGDETIDALRVAVNQTRFGVEVTRPVRMPNGLALAPFGELHVRRDGGAGQTGGGLELAGGLRASRGTIRVDAEARLLALHSAAGYRERGGSVTFSVGDGARSGPDAVACPSLGEASRYRRAVAGPPLSLHARRARG